VKVRIAPSAAAYMRQEVLYLRGYSPAAAQRFSDGLKRLKLNLTQFPHIGHKSDELPVPGVFRFVMDEYLVDYQVGSSWIDILAIRHGRQRPPGVPPEDDFDFEK